MLCVDLHVLRGVLKCTGDGSSTRSSSCEWLNEEREPEEEATGEGMCDPPLPTGAGVLLAAHSMKFTGSGLSDALSCG